MIVVTSRRFFYTRADIYRGPTAGLEKYLFIAVFIGPSLRRKSSYATVPLFRRAVYLNNFANTYVLLLLALLLSQFFSSWAQQFINVWELPIALALVVPPALYSVYCYLKTYRQIVPGPKGAIPEHKLDNE